jgi:hypothetical protein
MKSSQPRTIHVYLAHPRTGALEHFMAAMAAFKKRVAELPNVKLLPHYSDVYDGPPQNERAGLMAKTDLRQGADACDLFFMIRGQLPSEGIAMEFGVAYMSEQCSRIVLMIPIEPERLSPLLTDTAHDLPDFDSKVAIHPYGAEQETDPDYFMTIFMTHLEVFCFKP